MIETVIPTIAVADVSARRGQFTQHIEYTNQLGYPIAVILKNGMNAVIHPAMSIQTNGTFTITVTYSANHHSTLNQLSSFYKENPDLSKKLRELSAKSQNYKTAIITYTLTDEQVDVDGAVYLEELDIMLKTSMDDQTVHPGSRFNVAMAKPPDTAVSIELTGCGMEGAVYFVLFGNTVLRLQNKGFGIDRPMLNFTIDGEVSGTPVYLDKTDVHVTESDAQEELKLRQSSYNDVNGELLKGVKAHAEGHYKLISGGSKDFVSENSELVGSVNDMSSAIGKLENEIADARVHQRKVAGETIKLVSPIVTTIGKVVAL